VAFHSRAAVTYERAAIYSARAKERVVVISQSKVKNEQFNLPRNPHFDDGRILWNDSYSGLYLPVSYEEQFDRQWKLFLEREIGFHEHAGVETADEFIDDRIEDITGTKNYLLRRKYGVLSPLVSVVSGRWRRRKRRAIGGRLLLEPKFAIDFLQGKRCLDIGCGAGRWTRTMLSLGGEVKAVDVSENGLRSTRRFTADVEYLDLFDILQNRPDLHEAFDFALSWGVVMCTHDPRLAFENVARTVRPGGSLYLMVYAPRLHASEFVTSARQHYHRALHTPDSRHRYVLELAEKEPRNAINYHDMLNTFYNWVIDEDTIRKWAEDFDFKEPLLLNAAEKDACAHHMLLSKRKPVRP
jgi:SAM-dependent methyltransferase